MEKVKMIIEDLGEDDIADGLEMKCPCRYEFELEGVND